MAEKEALQRLSCRAAKILRLHFVPLRMTSFCVRIIRIKRNKHLHNNIIVNNKSWMYNSSAFGHNPSEDTERRIPNDETNSVHGACTRGAVFSRRLRQYHAKGGGHRREHAPDHDRISYGGAVSSVAPETPDPREADSVTDVLNRIRDAEADGLLMNYPAAAKVLTFCADGGTERETFERDVKAYFKTLDDAQREEFRAKFDAVLTLAENIAKGDVEQSDLEKADLKDFDPVTFQHENLETFTKTVTDALS